MSLLVASHAPLIPADVEICLEQRMAYVPGGAEEIKQMAENLYPQCPSSAAPQSGGFLALESRLPVMKCSTSPARSDESTCHIASCVMSLKATLDFCSHTDTRSRVSATPAIFGRPLDGTLMSDWSVSMFGRVSFRKHLQYENGNWVWETKESRPSTQHPLGKEHI